MSEYHQYLPSPTSLPGQITAAARRNMFRIFIDELAPARSDTILDVGVTSNQTSALDNYLEILYPFKEQITAAGLEDATHLEASHPGLTFVQLSVGPLPFEDRSFDFVHSSAVIEHVGSRQKQVEFLAELWQVARLGLFVTTPNRWYPVEFHTVLPLVHWLPPTWFQAILRIAGRGFYATEDTLNLMSSSTLTRAARAARIDKPQLQHVSLMGWPTNLLLIARRRVP